MKFKDDIEFKGLGRIRRGDRCMYGDIEAVYLGSYRYDNERYFRHILKVPMTFGNEVIYGDDSLIEVFNRRNITLIKN